MSLNIAIVTGANGFIGSSLTKKLLEKGVRVFGLDLPDCNGHLPLGDNNFTFVPSDDIKAAERILSKDNLSQSVLFHLGWIGKAGPLRADWRVQLSNVNTALEYYEMACRLGVRRFICAGTIGEKMLSVESCNHIKSQNILYVNAKLCLHRMLEAISTEGCRVIWALLGNMYGCGVSGGSLIDYALTKVLKGENAVFGPGLQPYDFVNVDDAIMGLAKLALADDLNLSEYYIGSGKPRALKDWLLELGEIAGRPDLIRIGGRADDGTRFKEEWFSTAALTSETGYKPTIPFGDGVRANISYLKGALK